MKKIYPNRLFSKIKTFPSKAVLWVSLIIITTINISYENWNEEYKIIAWDVNSYYAYLPMAFIYNDMEMNFIEPGAQKFGMHYWPITTETGKNAVITSMGMAYLYSPFFLAGHGIAQFTEFKGDEFSPPYKIALIISCLFYFAVGIFFLRKILLQYYSDAATSITLLLIIFGTNVLHYVTDEPTMTHAYSFALFALFLFYLIKLFKKPGIKYAVISGALAGLISLIRPSNFVIVILFILWDVGSIKDLGNRMLFYLKKFHLLLIMILAFIAVWVPQFLYWYHVSGSIFLYTYGKTGGNFYFDNPQIYYTLFSYRKGWLIYTPIMIFAIGGIYLLYKNKQKTFLPVLLYLLLNIYVVSSWWCWWYGGGYSQRSFVESYAILALPLGAFVAWALRRRLILKLAILTIFALLTYLAVFQTFQYRKAAVHNKMMTKASYWESFLDMTPSQRYWNQLVYPDYDAARQGKYYTEKEIRYSLEQKLDMRGWDYVDMLKDSILNESDWVQEQLQAKVDEASLDSLAYEAAMVKFRQVVERHNRENP